LIDLGCSIYFAFRFLFRYLFVAFFDYRAFGVRNVPPAGGVVLAPNHQSFFDPILVGLPLRRCISYAGRDSLFRNPIVRWALQSVGGVPVSRDAFAAGDFKRLVHVVEEGGALVLFPEGTRTRDGARGKPRRGFALVAERASVPVVPVLIHGANEAWPRDRKLFRRRRLRVLYGEAIDPSESLSADALTDRVASAWSALEERLRASPRLSSS
jgi:1-acyl-sn-glycerol-3-phosphate acyltransferase